MMDVCICHGMDIHIHWNVWYCTPAVCTNDVLWWWWYSICGEIYIRERWIDRWWVITKIGTVDNEIEFGNGFGNGNGNVLGLYVPHSQCAVGFGP